MVCSARGASCWVVVGWLPKVLMQRSRGLGATFQPAYYGCHAPEGDKMCWMICR
jgi:hypothetical protein